MPIYVNSQSDASEEALDVIILGYGTKALPNGGAVVRIEQASGQAPTVIVFGDIASEEPTHRISLADASNAERTETPAFKKKDAK